ncbi:MAG: Fe-S cluster assembly protein SufD [Candidatus Eremiobacteraeota bacterium]|nr:Fe-S cluster assembly protein SufD [Candidatus Eremiobacteraeota bacterium]
MPSVAQAAPYAGFDTALGSDADRAQALRQFSATRTGREKPSRYWKIDLEAIALDGFAIDPAFGSVAITSPSSRVIACDLESAARDHSELFRRAFGSAIEPHHKFAHLTLAFAQLGAFVYVPADCSIDDPIAITYRVAAGQSIFPYTVVLLERGARATIIERCVAGDGSFIAGVAEAVTGENSTLTYASVQDAPLDARVLFTRAARPGRGSTVAWMTAELGAALSVSDLAIAIAEPGADAQIVTLFFPVGSQHVDLASTIDHRVGPSRSQTAVKTAANGSGQGRYLGNIRIARNAQQSEASLRDDALLLSKTSHIDSIPALEIAANDVKAFHGATVGALDDEQIFYMQSRGIERNAAERMIALGFFEPVIERFPTQALREELRSALQRKVE